MVRVCLLAAALCLVRRGVSQEDCFPPDWLKSVSLSVKISKAGFHRDVEYSVRWSSAGRDVRAVLVQKLPSGVYMDEYELEALRRSSGPEVLLDARPDLEAPEYLSPGFTALVFLSGPRRVEVPVHGRYQRPSGSGGRVTVELERPRLLLRSDQCRTLSAEARLLEVRAPCTVSNTSTCSWTEVLLPEGNAGVSLEIPVGDSSMIICVCVVTVLTAVLSCVYLLTHIWKHVRV